MIGDLPDFRLETWFSRWEFAATHTFTASDAQTMSVAELLARAGRDVFDLADIDLGYRPTYGSAELRDAVAAAQYHVVSPDDVLAVALAELWHDRGMVLLCDEVYRGIEVEPCTTLPHGADLTASAVSVNVMSKSYGFPGLRVGWVATRDRACSNASSGASTYRASATPASPSTWRCSPSVWATSSTPETVRSSPPTSHSCATSSPASPTSWSSRPR